VPVIQLHSKHGVGQGFQYSSFDLYGLFFGHNQVTILQRLEKISSIPPRPWMDFSFPRFR
jgi:hypothetical protein